MHKGSQSKKKGTQNKLHNIVHKPKCRNGALFFYHRQLMPSQDGNENILTTNEFVIQSTVH